MRGVLHVIGSVVIVVGLVGGAVAADVARVEVRQGMVSAHFEAAPVLEALDAVKRATGVEIVVPASARDKSLTLTVDDAPFEQFVRLMLVGLELGGFALVYEATGVAQRVIVVDRAQGGPEDGSPSAAGPASTAGTGAEPIHVPPGTPPVYIPPATPPVYLPPTTPPVYIPPANPPVYVPPTTAPPQAAPSQ